MTRTRVPQVRHPKIRRLATDPVASSEDRADVNDVISANRQVESRAFVVSTVQLYPSDERIEASRWAPVRFDLVVSEFIVDNRALHWRGAH